MANRYPPTPSFGGAYPSVSYPSIPAQQIGHHMVTGRPPGTLPMSAPHPTSLGNPQSMNASHFAINAQIPSPAPVMLPLPPHQFPQELLKQLVNSALPPPPPPSLPPVPIPNLGFSAYQHPPNLSHKLPLPQNHNSEDPTGINGNVLQNLERAQPVSKHPSEPIMGIREEGELSDGELEDHSIADSSHTMSREQAPTAHVSRNTRYTNLETQGASGPSTRSSTPLHLEPSSAGPKKADFPPTHPSQMHSHLATDMRNVLQSQRKALSDTTHLSREGSGSSYDPPSVTTPDQALDVSSGRDETSHQIYDKSPSQMRELAKGALLSLAPHGIRYSDVVREGVDADLLQQLYEEIGIKESKPELSGGSYTYQTDQLPEQKKISSVSEPDKSTQLKISPDTPSAAPEILSTRDPRDASQIKIVAKPKSPTEAPKDTEVTSRQVQPALSLSTNSALVTTATNVAMERKDRIAQLLAAKTGKAGKSPQIQSAPSAVSVPIQVNSSAEPMLQVKVSTTSDENKTIHSVINQPVPKAVKNKAQTELVRQKMESLKKEAEAKARAQTQSQVPLPQRPSIPAKDAIATPSAPIAEQSLLTTVNQQDIAHANRSSEQSNTATSKLHPLPRPSPQASYVYRIPGLFMTSDEPLHTEEQLPTAIGSKADQSPYGSLDHEHDLEQESRASSVRDGSPTPGSLTEFNHASPVNQSSTSRLPQKRPLASDSFDEPAPPVKRPFGRKDSVKHIEIDVSSGSSDDGSDGIGMDIDEDSQASGLLINSAAPSKDASERDTELSLPAAKLLENPAGQQHMTNSIPGPSTPNKEKEKEDLWRAKNAEIDAMRKRIAEMEQRRKAKQSQSQPQSPQASLPSTPAPLKVQASSPIQASPKPGSTLQGYAISPTQPLSNMHTLMHKAANGDHQLSGPNSLSRLATESPSHNEDLRKKMARRKELQDGLPNLDAEVQATQLRLAQTKARLAAIKREAEKRELEIREARKREAEVAAEAMKLEEQLNMGLKGRNRFSEELQSLGADLEAAPAVQSTFAESLEPTGIALSSDNPSPPTNTSPNAGIQDMPIVGRAVESKSIGDVDGKIVIADGLIPKFDNSITEHEDPAPANSSNYSFPYETENTTPAATLVLNGRSSNELNDDSRSQSQTPVDRSLSKSSIVSHSSAGESVNIDSFVQIPSTKPDSATTELDYDNDGSVSMSDSGTDNYEPAEVPDTTHYSDMESEGYEPDDGLLQENHHQGDASDIDDDYEPAEEVEPMEVELRNIQPMSMDNYQHPTSSQPGPADEQCSDSQFPDSVDKSVVHDVGEGSESSEANTFTKSQDIPPQPDTGVETDDVSHGNQAVTTHFVPYESPLFFSKNFRFDPKFTALVVGGYNSLTFSNKIDPNRPLCPTEAEGGTCTDSKCEEQHFRQMTLPDDKILVEMSSARDFKQGDQRDRFLIGLKQVIAELRSKGVKEFPTVASALAAYRRTFAESIDPNGAISL